MKHLKLIGILTLPVAVSAMSGCQTMDKLTSGLRMLNPFGDKVVFVEPPETGELNDIHSLVIQSSNQNTTLFSTVKKSFKKASADGQPYFEQVLTSSPAQKTENKRWANVEVELTGVNSQVTGYQEDRMKCPGNKLVNSCDAKEAYWYKVNCSKRTTTVSGTLKATDVESNALLVSRDLFDSAESTLCSDEAGRALKSEHTLANEAASTLAVNLVSGLIPKRNERPSDLIDEIEVLSEADANSLEKATDEAAKGKMKTAKTGIESLLKRYPNNGALLFNAGYIEQALGNFSKAKGYYQSAQQSPFVPEDLNKYMVENDAWLQRGFTSVSKD